MDKILDIGDVFGFGISSFNPLLLIPVVFVVVGAVSVFMFGFKRAENPKFRRTVVSTENSNSNIKKKKRNTVSDVVASPGLLATANGVVKKIPRQTSPKQTQVKISGTTGNKDINALPVKNIVYKKTAKDIKTKNLAKNQTKNTVAKNDDDGEWQTVITKKQKKQTDSVSEIGVVGKTTKVDLVQLAKKKENIKKINKTQQSLPSPKMLNLMEPKKLENMASCEELSKPKDISENDFSESTSILANTEVNVVDNFKIKNTAVETNVAFDELGDSVLTETKPKKKNKKRALRE